MKFNKTLQRAVAVTTIPATWIDYKGLKKLLSEIKTQSPKGGGGWGGAAAAAASAAGASSSAAGAAGAAMSDMSEAARHQLLLACPDTCAFFAQVMCELHKVSCYYIKCEGELVSRYEGCLEKLHAFFVSHWVPPTGAAAGAEGEWSPAAKDHLPAIMGVLLSLTSELIQLENFSVLCYAGFGKILKKHDKLTGHTTCSPFMKVHVNPQEFASFTRLRQMLAGVERTYKLLTRLFKIPGDALALSSREAQHFKVLGMVRTESRVGDLVEGNSDDEEDVPMSGGGGGGSGSGSGGGGGGGGGGGESGAGGAAPAASAAAAAAAVESAVTVSAPALPANTSSAAAAATAATAAQGTSPTLQGTTSSGRSAAKRSRTSKQ